MFMCCQQELCDGCAVANHLRPLFPELHKSFIWTQEIRSLIPHPPPHYSLPLSPLLLLLSSSSLHLSLSLSLSLSPRLPAGCYGTRQVKCSLTHSLSLFQ